MSNRDEIRALLGRLRRIPGWTVDMSRGGHWRVRTPAGVKYFMSATPSDRRSVINARAQLRRLGADV